MQRGFINSHLFLFYRISTFSSKNLLSEEVRLISQILKVQLIKELKFDSSKENTYFKKDV